MSPWSHLSRPHPTRRTALQAGAVGLLGLGTNHVAGLRALAAGERRAVTAGRRPKAVIYIFLSGGLAQHDSFDLKPDAPDDIRGEFKPIATRTPGIQICEHLPLLAPRSHLWALVRSLTHPYNDHSTGHHVMLTGRTPHAAGLRRQPAASRPTGRRSRRSSPACSPPRNNLPPAVVLPEKLVHVTGRTIPGQFAGRDGAAARPWFIEASPLRRPNYVHGAFPEYGFDHQERQDDPAGLPLRGPAA